MMPPRSHASLTRRWYCPSFPLISRSLSWAHCRSCAVVPFLYLQRPCHLERKTSKTGQPRIILRIIFSDRPPCNDGSFAGCLQTANDAFVITDLWLYMTIGLPGHGTCIRQVRRDMILCPRMVISGKILMKEKCLQKNSATPAEA